MSYNNYSGYLYSEIIYNSIKNKIVYDLLLQFFSQRRIPYKWFGLNWSFYRCSYLVILMCVCEKKLTARFLELKKK